jgi:CDP-diglyceride synthetase
MTAKKRKTETIPEAEVVPTKAKKPRRFWRTKKIKTTKNHKGRVKTSILMGLLLLSIITIDAATRFPLIPIATLFIATCCVAELGSFPRNYKTRRAILVQGLVTILGTAYFCVAERFLVDGTWALYAFALIAAAAFQNIFAYYIGRFWLPKVANQTNLFARLLRYRQFHWSPKKTLGVTIVSTVFGLILSLGLLTPWDPATPTFWPIVIIVTLASLSSAFGDFIESRLKRLVDIHDSGEHLRRGKSVFARLERKISAHGGFLDRFDSIFFAATVCLPVIILIVLGVL